MGIRKLSNTKQWTEMESHSKQNKLLSTYPGFVRTRFNQVIHQLGNNKSLQGTEKVIIYGYKRMFPYETTMSIKGIEYFKKKGYVVTFRGNFSLNSMGLQNIMKRYTNQDSVSDFL